MGGASSGVVLCSRGDLRAQWSEHLQYAARVCRRARGTVGHSIYAEVERRGFCARVDPTSEPTVFRGATITRDDLQLLRSVRSVVRGRLLKVDGSGLRLEGGTSHSIDLKHSLIVDCTAAGLEYVAPTTPFNGEDITILHVSLLIRRTRPASTATSRRPLQTTRQRTR